MLYSSNCKEKKEDACLLAFVFVIKNCLICGLRDLKLLGSLIVQKGTWKEIKKESNSGKRITKELETSYLLLTSIVKKVATLDDRYGQSVADKAEIVLPSFLPSLTHC